MTALPHQRALQRHALMERLGLLGLVTPALGLILVIMLVPVGWLFYLSLLSDQGTWTLEHYQRMWVQPSYGRTFRTTFEVSFLTTGLCILLGYPLALVHNLTGTLIGTVHVMLPFMVLPLYSAMRAIDRNYLRAAANLGASPIRSFWLVFFPLAMPGLMTGSLIVFILCLGFYVTPAVLGGGKVIMESSRIANDIEMFFNWGAASALGVVLLVMTVLIVWVASRQLGIDAAMPRRTSQ